MMERGNAGFLIFEFSGLIVVEDYSILDVLLYKVLKCSDPMEGFEVGGFIEMYLSQLSFTKLYPENTRVIIDCAINRPLLRSSI